MQANRLLRNLSCNLLTRGFTAAAPPREAHLSISSDAFHFRFRQLSGVDAWSRSLHEHYLWSATDAMRWRQSCVRIWNVCIISYNELAPPPEIGCYSCTRHVCPRQFQRRIDFVMARWPVVPFLFSVSRGRRATFRVPSRPVAEIDISLKSEPRTEWQYEDVGGRAECDRICHVMISYLLWPGSCRPRYVAFTSRSNYTWQYSREWPSFTTEVWLHN